MSTTSKTITQGKDNQVITGIRDELQPTSTLVLGTKTFTPQSLADFVQRRIDLGSAVGVARAAWLEAIRVYDVANRETNVVLSDLRNVVIAAFGRDSQKLAAFGFKPPARPVLTAEQRTAAVQKAKATRKARKTMGKKQKALIKGEVPAVAVESTASVASAASAAPAVTI